MKIFVKVFASLRKKYPSVSDLNPLEMEIDKGTTLAQLIARLNFNQEEVKIILVNGLRASVDDIINEESSIISLFPAVGGG
ncbi:MAG: MoaD/ThiS family protein [Candidatus Heimdallarchaeota archaeon]|nr:MoaD/ThiS family protein [Candidatus Heimdallarchaeota archaeon]MCG3256593.1 MoaD/ThiS family protein [Candidatus Heimdallarchaeota archaeon]MCK4611658.1 MoaD/ThiS family protein [Candidatus Heimdallarchaeota archaeon]